MTRTANRNAIGTDIIRVARELLDGRLWVHGRLKIEFDELHTEWQHLLMKPGSEVARLSEPGSRNCLHPLGGSLSREEEEAVLAAELDELGRSVAARIYLSAIEECVNALCEMSSTSRPFRSYRMVARMCSAIREELQALLQEWDSLGLGPPDS